ncbi:MAG: DNA repair protein RecN [Rhodospirillaceae bacterium]
MLRSLIIRDYVIVDRLQLDFERGYTALTGETGAGKSILIDALALALGERNDGPVVRPGAERADITAEFEVESSADLGRWLADNELEPEEDRCLLRRVIEASGRSRSFINGRPATLAQCRELGAFLLDVHGQHQHQSLLGAATQRSLLDGYGGCMAQSAAVSAAWRTWQQRKESRIAFETNAAAYAAERESLEWTVRELDALAFSNDEWQELQAEHGRLSHAASLIEAAESGMEALSEGENAALSRVNGVVSALQQLADYDPALREILEVLEPARIQLQEAVYALRHYQQRLELDPQRLKEVEQRLDAVHSAARKYRVRPEELTELLDKHRARLEELAPGADNAALRKLEEEAQAVYLAEAKKLTAARKKAAKQLSEQVVEAMQRLAMAGGVFEVKLEPLAEPAAYGMEQVEFRVAAHPGMAPQPLAKVASGGELSRISLAIQTATSQVAEVPTLIFDEVDAGIGGRVAEMVGKMLRELGKRHQVLCVTHLPQVAASADHQWQVSKTAKNGAVTSRVAPLDREQRVEEIARMLGGIKITETTRKHAAEMLGYAKNR